MASFEVATKFAAPAEAVWGYVSWEGMPQLTEGGFFTRADFPLGEGARPGMQRRVYGREGAPFIESLLEYREEEFFYRYAMVDTGDLPITDYTGVVKITPAGAGCCLKFGHTATVFGCTDEEWRALWVGIEREVFDFIRAKVE